MLNFLKRFALGIVYVLISPFAIGFLLAWCLNNIVVFFIEMIKGIKSFLSGGKFFKEFPEDVEAKRILSLEPYNNRRENMTINTPIINQNNEEQR